MRLVRVSSNQSLAVTRINLLLDRVFSFAAPLVGVQMTFHALEQSEKLNPVWFWPSLTAFAISYLGIIYSVWFSSGVINWYRALVLTTIFSLCTWPLQVGSLVLEQGEQPWIWWSVGIASITSVGAFSVPIAVLMNIAFPVIWFVLQVSEIGGPVRPLVALQDSALSLLFAGLISVLVLVLRYEAAKVDAANQVANLAAIELAKTDAVERERARLDALVHDSVLTTLLTAANAKDSAQQSAAALLAEDAINKLTAAANENAVSEDISFNSLFTALEVAIERQASGVEVEIEGATDQLVPGEVAAALTEATLQALANSLQHAGASVNRRVLLKGASRGIKILVIDNGRGFRVARIPKNRLGVRLSIIGRVESVGGEVHIDSKLGVGTTIIIEWGKK
jgi:signal transduction histidine kinase